MRVLTPRSATLLASAALAAASLASASADAQGAPKPILMREIGEPTGLDPQWPASICALPGLTCGDEGPRLFETRGSTREFYAIVNPTTLARLDRSQAGAWRVAKRWNFSGYPLRPGEMDGRETPPALDIHPALYPAGPDLWAVAVLTRRTESYSGGSLEAVRADFVVLEPETADLREAQTLHADVPFSCSRSIRACFTPSEHKTSPHCQDQASGYLSLSIAPSAGRHYAWSATFHETRWPAGVPKSQQTKSSTPVPLSAKRARGVEGSLGSCAEPG